MSEELKVIEDSAIEILMSKEEAQELTKDIQSTSTALYILLKKAHDKRAWVSMGYKSWAEYINKEFEFSRQRSYQLINQAQVIEELSDASGSQLYITERDARSIKKRLPEITEKLEAVKKEDLTTDEAREKAMKVIAEDYDDEVDKSKGFQGGGEQRPNDGYADEKEDNSAMEEWKPEGIDMEAMKNMLPDEDKFYFDNLIVTLKIFESMPEAVRFGRLIKKSNEDKKSLKKLSEQAFSWITQLLDEIE